MTPVLVVARSASQFELGAGLFREYAAGLGVDLCFQNFDAELGELATMYGPPGGCLLLLMRGEVAMGCGALRALEGVACEMKRLYVRPAERGGDWGRRLARELIRQARALKYRVMRLDTLADMAPARHIYQTLGFREIEPYYANPLTGAVYLELDLEAPPLTVGPGEA